MPDDHDGEPTQQTQPKKGEPIEIPVPKKGDVIDFLEKTAKLPDPDRDEAPPHGDPLGDASGSTE